MGWYQKHLLLDSAKINCFLTVSARSTQLVVLECIGYSFWISGTIIDKGFQFYENRAFLERLHFGTSLDIEIVDHYHEVFHIGNSDKGTFQFKLTILNL